MCGRFVQRYTWDDIQDLYELPDGPARNLQAHYNVAPTDPVEVVRPAANGTAELISMRWGLIPWWWKKPLKQLPASFNARAESVADKPMFRDAFRHRGLRRSKDDVHQPAPLVPRRYASFAFAHLFVSSRQGKPLRAA